MYDFMILGGSLIDGTGKDAYVADVAAKDGKIVAIGDLGGEEAKQTFDAGGKWVTPGFIDAHSHADCMVALCPDFESLTVQGITTVYTGHCGISIAPMVTHYMGTVNDSEAMERVLPPLFSGGSLGDAPVVNAGLFRAAYGQAYGVDLTWGTWADYLAHIERSGVGVNMVSLVGHGAVRHQVLGTDYRRAATTAEIDQMSRLLHDCMESGANGLSFGFDYSPGDYADEREILALAKIVAQFDGIVSAHTQHRKERRGTVNERFQYHQGHRELLEIGLKTGVRVQLSHVRPAYGGLPDDRLIEAASAYVLDMIDEYRNRGVRVGWDVLPHYMEATFFNPMFASKLQAYVEQCGSLASFQEMLHNPEYYRRLYKELEQGINPGVNAMNGINVRRQGWDTMREVNRCSNKEYLGKTISDLAVERHLSSLDMYLQLLAEDVYACGRLRVPEKSRLGLEFFANHPEASFGLDVTGCNYAGCNRETRPDMPPKYIAAHTEFSGMIHHLASGLISRREDAIASVTGRTARNIGLRDRGFIEVGLQADIVIMDWNKLDTNVDYLRPNRAPKGIDHVFVNGQLSAQHGRALNPRAGRVIRNCDRQHA